MKTITVELPQDLYSQIETISTLEGQSMACLLRESLKAWLSQQKDKDNSKIHATAYRLIEEADKL